MVDVVGDLMKITGMAAGSPAADEQSLPRRMAARNDRHLRHMDDSSSGWPTQVEALHKR